MLSLNKIMGMSAEWQLDNKRLVKDYLIKYKYFKTE